MVSQMLQMLVEVVEALRGRGTWNAPGFSGLDVPLETRGCCCLWNWKAFLSTANDFARVTLFLPTPLGPGDHRGPPPHFSVAVCGERGHRAWTVLDGRTCHPGARGQACLEALLCKWDSQGICRMGEPGAG